MAECPPPTRASGAYSILIPASRAGESLPKFYEGGLLIVRAGGPAGLFSAFLPGWIAGRNPLELQPVTKEIKP